MLRKAILVLHRYIGLVLALFLFVSGISGSIIAFYSESDALLNPDLFRVRPTGAGVLEPGEIVEAIESADPRVRVWYLPLDARPSRAAVVYLEARNDPATGAPFDVDYDEVFIDPYSGSINGQRLWGECCDRANVVPLVHKLHNRMMLPSAIGHAAWGTIAIAWALMAVGGLVLTFPPGERPLKKWKSSWLVRTGRSFLATTFQLHRAVGLWLWLVVLMLAVTGVSLTLDEQVFQPLVRTVSTVTPSPWADQRLYDPVEGEPRIGFTGAVAAASRYLDSIGAGREPGTVQYSSSRGLYRVSFGNPMATGTGLDRVYVSAHSGEVVGRTMLAEGTLGDRVNAITHPLHSGRAGGIVGRWVIFLAGWLVALLSVTGVVVWWRRR